MHHKGSRCMLKLLMEVRTITLLHYAEITFKYLTHYYYLSGVYIFLFLFVVQVTGEYRSSVHCTLVMATAG